MLTKCGFTMVAQVSVQHYRYHTFYSLHNSSSQYSPVYPGGHTQVPLLAMQEPPFRQEQAVLERNKRTVLEVFSTMGKKRSVHQVNTTGISEIASKWLGRWQSRLDWYMCGDVNHVWSNINMSAPVMTIPCIPLTWAIEGRRQAYHVPACFSVHMTLNILCVDINCPTPGIQEVYTLVQWHVI